MKNIKSNPNFKREIKYTLIMIYFFNKFQKNNKTSHVDFLRVVEFLKNEGFIKECMQNYEDIYSYYKEKRCTEHEKSAKLNTMEKFNIGKVTFYKIKKLFNE